MEVTFRLFACFFLALCWLAILTKGSGTDDVFKSTLIQRDEHCNQTDNRCKKKYKGICKETCDEDEHLFHQCKDGCTCCGCKTDGKCVDVGGTCIPKGSECSNLKVDKFCEGKDCTCCLPVPDPCPDPQDKCLEQCGYCDLECKEDEKPLSGLCEKENCSCCVKDHSTCPDKTTKVCNECFFLSRIPLPWAQARSVCEKFGGDLAVPSNVTCLRDFISSEPTGPGVWIGGADEDEDGTWHYVDGTLINEEDWAEGQPDNIGKENCLEIQKDSNPPLNAKRCHKFQKFVCEFEPIPS